MEKISFKLIAKIMSEHGITTKVIQGKIFAYSYCYDRNGIEFLEKTDVTNYSLQDIKDYLGY